MASIGAYSFIALNAVSGAGEEEAALEVIERRGVDGVLVREQGERPADGVYRSVADFDSAAGAESAKNGYRQVQRQGAVVTLTDEMGRTWSVLVMSVGKFREKKAGAAAGGLTDGLYIVEAEWVVKFV